MRTFVAVLLAIAAALFFNLSMYTNKKAVLELPKVGLKKREKGIFRAFLSNRLIWLFALFGLLGGAFYFTAVSLAPISVVQPIVSSGIVILAYLAIKNLGETPRKIDYMAISFNICGVVLIGVSLAEGLPEETKHNPSVLWITVAAIVTVAIFFGLFSGRTSGDTQGALLGICVGLLYGTGTVFARLMLLDWKHQWDARGFLVIFSSIFLLGWLFTFLPALMTVQAAFQRGMAVVVAPIFASLTQLVPIFVGMTALGEKPPANTLLLAARIIAFLLIISGTIILSRRAQLPVKNTIIKKAQTISE